MKSYLEIMSNVLERGERKGSRTGVGTLALPNQFFSHDMSEGFPLLTTKKMPMKTIAVELEGFINGITYCIVHILSSKSFYYLLNYKFTIDIHHSTY